MALQKNLSLTNNFGTQTEFSNAYIKVSRIEGDKSEVLATVSYMTEKDGRELMQNSFYVPVELNETNFIAQVYAHLKTLEDFSGAKDC